MSQLSFLPEPRYNPKYPLPHTLAHKALKLLLKGRKLSHPQFEAATGSWRLAAYIHILKKKGWPVKKDGKLLRPDEDKMRDRHVGVYFLPQDLLEIIKGG